MNYRFLRSVSLNILVCPSDLLCVYFMLIVALTTTLSPKIIQKKILKKPLKYHIYVCQVFIQSKIKMWLDS